MEGNAKAAIAEGIGTFALIFFGAGSVVLYLNGQLDLVGVALANGLVIAVMVSQMAHLSGGVFNPAILIALWVTGKVPSVADARLPGRAAARGSCGRAAAEVPGPGAGVRRRPRRRRRRSATGSRRARASCSRRSARSSWSGRCSPRSIDDRGPFGKTAGLTIGLTHHVRHPGDRPVDRRRVQPRALVRARRSRPAIGTTGTCGSSGPIAGGVLAGVAYWGLFLRDKEPATP